MTAYTIEMTSQTWRAPDEIDPHQWTHLMAVYVPDNVQATTTARLALGGGDLRYDLDSDGDAVADEIRQCEKARRDRPPPVAQLSDGT